MAEKVGNSARLQLLLFFVLRDFAWHMPTIEEVFFNPSNSPVTSLIRAQF